MFNRTEVAPVIEPLDYSASRTASRYQPVEIAYLDKDRQCPDADIASGPSGNRS